MFKVYYIIDFIDVLPSKRLHTSMWKHVEGMVKALIYIMKVPSNAKIIETKMADLCGFWRIRRCMGVDGHPRPRA